jgi:hypothetical protein
MSRYRQGRGNQRPDCAREWQSWAYNTDEDEGREARWGSMEADKENGGWGERGEEKGQRRPGHDT